MGRSCGVQGTWGAETHTRMKAMVGKERSDTSRTRDGVIGGEFGKREPFNPVLLRVVYIVAKILL
jgi:hypothetical protein